MMPQIPEETTSAAPVETKPTKTKRAKKAKTTEKTALKARQFRILQALAKLPSGGSLSRAKISEKVFNGNSVNLSNDLGAATPAERETKEKASGYPSLRTLKMITSEVNDLDGKSEESFSITATGQKALKTGCQDPRLPKPGTVITRNYKDKDYKVTVLESGFRFGKETFTSLTAVAKAIVGKDSEINGFHWFGLTEKQQAEKNGKPQAE